MEASSFSSHNAEHILCQEMLEKQNKFGDRIEWITQNRNEDCFCFYYLYFEKQYRIIIILETNMFEKSINPSRHLKCEINKIKKILLLAPPFQVPLEK